MYITHHILQILIIKRLLLSLNCLCSSDRWRHYHIRMYLLCLFRRTADTILSIFKILLVFRGSGIMLHHKQTSWSWLLLTDCRFEKRLFSFPENLKFIPLNRLQIGIKWGKLLIICPRWFLKIVHYHPCLQHCLLSCTFQRLYIFLYCRQWTASENRTYLAKLILILSNHS